MEEIMRKSIYTLMVSTLIAVVVSLASLLSADVSFSCVDSAAVVSAVVVSDGWLEQAVMLSAAMRVETIKV